MTLPSPCGPVLLVSAAIIFAAVHFVHPAPPHLLTMTAGPDGSSFRTYAERYKKILARNGSTLGASCPRRDRSTISIA